MLIGGLSASVKDSQPYSREVTDELATSFGDRNGKQNVMGSGRMAVALVMKPDFSSLWEEDSTLCAASPSAVTSFSLLR